MKTNASRIGSDLIAASRELEKTADELLCEMFPFVYEASHRMSTRQISRWLLEKHRIQISQPTIWRALKNPERFWTEFAGTVAPVMRAVATFLEIETKEMLLADGAEISRRFQAAADKSGVSTGPEDIEKIRAAIDFLEGNWWCLSLETRRACIPFLPGDEPEEEEMLW